MLSRIVMLSLLLAGTPLQAEEQPIAACLSCHAADATAAAPLLDGQNEVYLVNQLTRFRDHVRESFPMDALSQGLSDAQIADLAQAFAARPWYRVEERADAGLIAQGADLASRHQCADCHGPRMRGADAVPRLAGQRSMYLTRQVEAFAADDRFHPPTGIGARMYRMDAEQAAALAAWLAAQR